MPDELLDYINNFSGGGKVDPPEESGALSRFKNLYDTLDTEWLPSYDDSFIGQAVGSLKKAGWNKTARFAEAVTKPQREVANQLVGSPLRAASTAGSVATMGAGSVPALMNAATQFPKAARVVSDATRLIDAAGAVRGAQDAKAAYDKGNYLQAGAAAAASALGGLGAVSNPLASVGKTNKAIPFESSQPAKKPVFGRREKVVAPGNPTVEAPKPVMNPVVSALDDPTPPTPIKPANTIAEDDAVSLIRLKELVAKAWKTVDKRADLNPSQREGMLHNIIAESIQPYELVLMRKAGMFTDDEYGKISSIVRDRELPNAIIKAQEDGKLYRARMARGKGALDDSEDNFIPQSEGGRAGLPAEPQLLPKDMNPAGGYGFDSYQPAGAGRHGTQVNPKGFKTQLPPELEKATPDEAFRHWVNHRETSLAAGLEKGKEFKEYEGVSFTDYQNNPGVAPKLQDYFARRHKELTDAGIKLGTKENYLPQLWENPELLDTLPKEFRKRLGLKPSFSFESVVKNYEEGIKLGLIPKYKNLGELAEYYESAASKAIADRQFFDYLKQNKLIKKAGERGTKGWAKEGWKPIDFDFFPQAVLKRADGNSRLTRWIVSPNATAGELNILERGMAKATGGSQKRSLYDAIQNYLKPGNAGGEFVGDLASVPKNVVLSGGIPKTGINFHGWNVLNRRLQAADDKGSAFLTGAWDLANPAGAAERLSKAGPRLLDARRHGLTATSEDMNPQKYLQKAVKEFGPYAKLEGKLDELFAVPLFGKVLPAWKLEAYESITSGLIQDGMTPLQIARVKRDAAKQVNDLYGGINWKELGESKNMHNLLRATLLAPDWLRSNYRMGKGAVNALKNPRSPQTRMYRNAMGTVLGAYTAMNLTNKAMTGKWTWENDPGHEFDVAIGKDQKGRIMYARPFGTAADFARIPFQVARSILSKKPGEAGQVALNRTSIPVRQAHDWVAGDYRGDKLLTNRYGQQKSAGEVGATLADDAKGLLPGPIQGPIDFAIGNVSLPQAVARTVEAPIGFAYPKERKKKLPSY